MSSALDLKVKRINTFRGEGSLRAFCDVAVCESFLIKGVRVVEGRHGLFVSLPREQGKNGQWYETVIPLSKEVRARLTRTVLDTYQSEQPSGN